MSHRDDVMTDALYAHAYLAELQDLQLATQVRVLRDQRGWTQEDLAERTGMRQARISLIESGEYSGFTLSTLRKLARAFDIGLRVLFAPYHATVDELERLDSSKLRVPKRTHELLSASATQSEPLDFELKDALPVRAFRIAYDSSANAERAN